MFINKFNFSRLCLSVWNAVSSANFRSAAIEGDLSQEHQSSKNPFPISKWRAFPALCVLRVGFQILNTKFQILNTK